MPDRIIPRRPTRKPPEEEEFDPKDDDGDEPPRRVARGVKSATSSTRRPASDDDTKQRPVRKGWGGAHRVKEMSGDFPDNLALDDEPALIKFLEDGPFASYRQHWIEREGKKSWTCHEDGCPLCEIGDKPQGKYCFNVLLLSEGEPVLKVWTIGPRVLTQVETFHKDKKTGPLTRLYWAVSRTGKGNKASTSLIPVKERDLADDWEMDPLDDDILTKFEKQCFDEEAIPVQTRKQLKEIADEVADEE